MLASQRQERILAEVRDQGAVRIADLTRELEVSDMTVRRDLMELADQGLVRKVHGGAVSPHTTAHEPGFAAKSGREAGEKRVIAEAAARLIAPSSSIALSAGTTTHLLAAQIVASPDLRPLTVVTNSLPVAETLYRANDPRLEVILTGGSRTPSDALVGPLAEAALVGLRVDQTFLGAHGVDPDVGLTTPNLDEAATNRALIHCAGRTVVLADHTKWHTTGLRVFATFADVDVLVTDSGLPTDARTRVDDLVEQLVVA
ncbi:DeoR/GlpR family DNA-binding transcription regulator [Cellulosimicrobium arenosum]|uniref:DeoR/GlpR transcriptional regulator n=1 Tax=Cellulosimicrobium arenosum TaxID=2708133 RepID=A0A927G7D9_9MICO|nr:DeoR/GlpR family DNA-binding transcription regulator [Cellulosimicrobium arenosum]MBD8078253.1 DeoR/GlpR transcriptional regulator [Cellulosimicrobium arenosum]